jgi:hypothetical protein
MNTTPSTMSATKRALGAALLAAAAMFSAITVGDAATANATARESADCLRGTTGDRWARMKYCCVTYGGVWKESTKRCTWPPKPAEQTTGSGPVAEQPDTPGSVPGTRVPDVVPRPDKADAPVLR